MSDAAHARRTNGVNLTVKTRIRQLWLVKVAIWMTKIARVLHLPRWLAWTVANWCLRHVRIEVTIGDERTTFHLGDLGDWSVYA